MSTRIGLFNQAPASLKTLMRLPACDHRCRFSGKLLATGEQAALWPWRRLSAARQPPRASPAMLGLLPLPPGGLSG